MLSRYIIYMNITNIVMIEMFIIYICILLHDFARTNSQRSIFCRESSLSELESLFLVIRLKAFLSHGSVSYYDVTEYLDLFRFSLIPVSLRSPSCRLGFHAALGRV